MMVASSVKPTTVQVVAPANLPGGYEFLADVEGTIHLVRVPHGGAYQGKTILAQVVQPVSAPTYSPGHNIPFGKWRDGFCECGAHGWCHPMCLVSCICPPVSLGQTMTRMNLDACGRVRAKGAKPEFWSPFKVLMLVYILSAVVNLSLLFLIPANSEDPENFSVMAIALTGGRTVVDSIFFLYIFSLMIYTRGYIRQRYAIPVSDRCAGCEGSCEDACCSALLPCCTTAQMARHTAAYNTYNALCCSDTGLSSKAPPVVV